MTQRIFCSPLLLVVAVVVSYFFALYFLSFDFAVLCFLFLFVMKCTYVRVAILACVPPVCGSSLRGHILRVHAQE